MHSIQIKPFVSNCDPRMNRMFAVSKFFYDKDIGFWIDCQEKHRAHIKTHEYVTSVVFWEDFNLYSDFQINQMMNNDACEKN